MRGTAVRGTAVGEEASKDMWATGLPASKGGERPTKAIHLLRLSRGSITLAICRAREVSSMNESILGFGAVLIDHSDLSQKKRPPPTNNNTHTQNRPTTHTNRPTHTHIQHTNTHCTPTAACGTVSPCKSELANVYAAPQVWHLANSLSKQAARSTSRSHAFQAKREGYPK